MRGQQEQATPIGQIPEYPVLIGSVALRDGVLIVDGDYQEYSVDIDSDVRLALSILAVCNGRHSKGTILAMYSADMERSDAHRFLSMLAEVGLIVDRTRMYQLVHDITANSPDSATAIGSAPNSVTWPRRVVLGTAESADQLRTAGRSTECAGAPGLGDLLRDRNSLAWPPESNGHARQEIEMTVRELVNASYGREGGPRPIASAGALYPLIPHLIAVRNPGSSPESIIYDDALGWRAGQTLGTRDDFAGCFIDGREFLQALDLGYMLVAMVFDLDRFCGKYAGRGYRFALIEAGLFSQTLTLCALERKMRVRLMGGYFDERLDRYLRLPERCRTLLVAVVGS